MVHQKNGSDLQLGLFFTMARPSRKKGRDPHAVSGVGMPENRRGFVDKTQIRLVPDSVHLFSTVHL